MIRTVFVVLGLGLGLAGLSAQTPNRAALPDALNKTIAYYATCASYADTGTLREELPGIVERVQVHDLLSPGDP